MGDHSVVNVNQLPKPEAVDFTGKKPEMVGSSSSSMAAKDDKVVVVVENEEADEESPLIGMGECRICQEEDSLSNLESPCACSGSLKYAHRKCVQHWCNEKGDITCEICHQQYQPGYTAIPRPPADETTIDIGGVWQISGTPLDMHDPRLLAIAEAERQLFEADYDDYNGANSSGAAFCRSAALILMALLLLRHALSITDDGEADGDDDASAFLSVTFLASSRWLSSALLHHDLGHQYLATQEAKTGPKLPHQMVEVVFGNERRLLHWRQHNSQLSSNPHKAEAFSSPRRHHHQLPPLHRPRLHWPLLIRNTFDKIDSACIAAVCGTHPLVGTLPCNCAQQSL
ncbi:E3 ubiquitin-protein ligase march3 [Phtheirospermum japonicum]|uniref:E3 ubiquitin-protein ligase march3 n=1 Tax=Phtheirospermum japonicum TaxID=374723 RepID=A0A830BMH1_9LAMI|nr:E3 ubiquitin-protein ligase march3 [Phtheirospermum japonicum]